jgi:hypothetical protein
MKRNYRFWMAVGVLGASACAGDGQTTCFDGERSVDEIEVEGQLVHFKLQVADSDLSSDAGVDPSCRQACDDWNRRSTCRHGTLTACRIVSMGEGGANAPMTMHCRLEYAPYCVTLPVAPC